jgi:phosphonate metabolism-associated iron-containing alcohol dehydrogenase
MWIYENPVRIRFGAGSLDLIGDLVDGRAYCLVTYDEPMFLDIARRIAAIAGPAALTIDNVTPNPDFHMLTESCARFAGALAVGTRAAPEVIVALGGGSVIDAAKVIAAGSNGFDAVRRVLENGAGDDALTAIPIIAIPTTAGTGSEVTCWSAVWDTDAGRKHSLSHPSLYPTDALIDPELMVGMPRALTVSTALDALSHSLESIWNVNGNPVSTNHAVNAATEIMASLPGLVDDLGNPDLRVRIARAATFAGLAFSNTKTALAHSISYPITLRHGTPHGVACSFSLPMVMRSVIGAGDACDAGLRRIFGSDLAAGADRLEEFLVNLGVSVDKADYGIDDEEWRQLIESAITGERGRNFIGSQERVTESLGGAKR